jgi:uncharacterized phage-like protein YoqJ
MSSCSFTGHRIIPDNIAPKLEKLLGAALEYLWAEGCRDFYAGGALGFDTMCAKAVILFKMTHPGVKLHLVLPCKNQDERWSDAQRDVFGYTLAAADDVEYVSEDYTKDCMKRRNERLAALGDCLVAYAGKYNSGAGQTVRMANALGKTVYNLYSRAHENSGRNQ